jgi:flagella synthesis protein FlgN
VSARLEQVKLLLRGIRLDSERYQQLYTLLEEQRMGMIRRASDALAVVNGQIDLLYPALSASARTRHETLLSLGVTPDSAGMAQVFSWLPAAQKAAANQAWQQLAGSVAACRRFNEKNGELLIRQYAFVRDFLGFEPDFIYRP